LGYSSVMAERIEGGDYPLVPKVSEAVGNEEFENE
jgi:hypothetical protein